MELAPFIKACLGNTRTWVQPCTPCRTHTRRLAWWYTLLISALKRCRQVDTQAPWPGSIASRVSSRMSLKTKWTAPEEESLRLSSSFHMHTHAQPCTCAHVNQTLHTHNYNLTVHRWFGVVGLSLENRIHVFILFLKLKKLYVCMCVCTCEWNVYRDQERTYDPWS